jgi:hypothetical protein
MLNWRGWFGTAPGANPSTVRNAAVQRPEPHSVGGKYRPLYTYLENRYATTVVLTLSEIEDLLGFALPAGARTDGAWWTVGDPNTAAGAYADAWKSASRTAVPNLVARAVVFERVTHSSRPR